MAASERELGDAYRAGWNRKPLPEALASDSTAHGLYLQGQDDRDAGRPKDPNMWNLGRPSSGDDSGEAPANSTRQKRSGGTRSPGGKTTGRAYSARSSQPRKRSSGKYRPKLASSARQLVTHPASLGGDGGGLMLAVFAYPIVLAILQHGPEGAVIWLKAKFLNQGSPQKGPHYVYPDPLKQKPA